MRLSQIMRTNVGPERLTHSLLEKVEVHTLDPEDIDATAIYEITGGGGEKVGELRGTDLRYLAQASRGLNLGEIINAFEDGVVVIDTDGRICFENEAYSRIVGVPMRKTIGRNLRVIEPDAQLLKVLECGQSRQQNRKLIRSVGKYVAMRMQPILRDGRVVGAFSVFRDITELNALGWEVQRITGVAEEYGSCLGVRQELARMQVISRSAAYTRLIEQAATVSPTDATVLIRGENGAGKEIISRFIHQNSRRKDKPLITVNCAAIPESLIESELFGYEEGSFTGSRRGGKVGKFELAQNGTLFLDEIGDMPITMQAKLLRVLQEGEIEKIGREENIPVDVRIIAATNQPLEEMIAQKTFRQDLYFRLNVITLFIPPLRERREDIIPLCDRFLAKFNEKYSKHVILAPEVYTLLEGYSWPGNVRQLQNCIESAVIMAGDGPVEAVSLPVDTDQPMSEKHLGAFLPAKARGTLSEEVAQFERTLIDRVIRECRGDREKAARQLGISLRTLYRKR